MKCDTNINKSNFLYRNPSKINFKSSITYFKFNQLCGLCLNVIKGLDRHFRGILKAIQLVTRNLKLSQVWLLQVSALKRQESDWFKFSGKYSTYYWQNLLRSFYYVIYKTNKVAIVQIFVIDNLELQLNNILDKEAIWNGNTIWWNSIPKLACRFLQNSIVFTTDDYVPILKVLLYYTLGDKETLGQWSGILIITLLLGMPAVFSSDNIV